MKITSIETTHNFDSPNIVTIEFLYNGYIAPNIFYDIISTCCGKHLVSLNDEDDMWTLVIDSDMNPSGLDHMINAINSIDAAMNIGGEFSHDQYCTCLRKYM